MTNKIVLGLSLALALTAGAANAKIVKIAAPSEPALQATYSTDKFLTCDSLVDEAKRMDFFINTKGVDAATVKTAKERKQIVGAILKEKTSCAQQAKNFGPGMYD